MTTHGLVVVGSGPSGVSAAEAFRRHHSRLPVRIVTQDPALPYARPPLSKEYLRGDDGDIAVHPAKWFDDNAIELIRGAVGGIDVAGEAIVTDDGTRYEFDALVLACGACPVPLPVPGGDRALQLRSLADATRLRDSAQHTKTAVVVGAGFIGCEAAASLAMRGISTYLLAPESVPQSKRLGSEVGKRILYLLGDVGVSYAGGVRVTRVDEDKIHLDNGVAIDCDLVLAATGVKPRSSLADDAGITTSEGRIVVDEYLRTSADHIFAAGDVAMAHNITAGRRIMVEHWQDAMDQGDIAGANAAGESKAWDTVPGFWTTIGDATLKYHSWGDGYETSRLVDRGDDGFTVWYESEGKTVGVLTLNADDDYDRGEDVIRNGRPAPTGQ